MLIKTTRIMDGPGPSEVIVKLMTAEGRVEEVVVDVASLQGDGLEVGPVLAKRDELLLIELPRETASGRLRLWIPDSERIKELEAAE